MSIKNAKKNATSLQTLAYYALLNTQQTDVKVVNKFGQNTDIDSIATEDVWSAGGTRSYLSTAEQINVSSTSGNDTSAGTGAQLVYLTGLDANYEEQGEVIVMNGTSDVLSALTYIEISRLVVYTAGSLETNAGDIFMISADSTTTLGEIVTGNGITQQSHYTVPAGYTGYLVGESISSYRADGLGTRQAEITLQVKGFGNTAWIKSRVIGLNSATQSTHWDVPYVLPSKARIKYSAKAAANNTAVSVSYDIVLIKNEEIN